MLYPDKDIVVKVYYEPLYIIQFKRWITYEGVGVSFRPEDLYIQLSRVLYSHNAHTLATMVHSSGVCRYMFPFSTPMNPQDPPDNFTRDETQGQRGFHVHALTCSGPLRNLQMMDLQLDLHLTFSKGRIHGGNPNEG